MASGPTAVAPLTILINSRRLVPAPRLKTLQWRRLEPADTALAPAVASAPFSRANPRTVPAAYDGGNERDRHRAAAMDEHAISQRFQSNILHDTRQLGTNSRAIDGPWTPF